MVKRYDVDSDPQDGPCSLWQVESDEGQYVQYEDYATLKAELDAMAAENAGLKAANAEGCKWDGEQWVVLSVETPATDRFLAEVKAQGVDAAIEHLHNKFEGTGNIGVPVMALEWFSQQLRGEKAE